MTLFLKVCFKWPAHHHVQSDQIVHKVIEHYFLTVIEHFFLTVIIIFLLINDVTRLLYM